MAECRQETIDVLVKALEDIKRATIEGRDNALSHAQCAQRGVAFCSECRTDKGELLYFSPHSQRYVHSSCRTPADDPALTSTECGDVK